MKMTQRLEMTTEETALIESLTGQRIESSETTLELPPECTELAGMVIKAIPVIKSLLTRMGQGIVMTETLNGVEVRRETLCRKPAEEEVAEEKAA